MYLYEIQKNWAFHFIKFELGAVQKIRNMRPPLFIFLSLETQK